MSLRLEDIELIKRVKHTYFRSIDMGDIKALEDLFIPDVQVLYVGGDLSLGDQRSRAVTGLDCGGL